MLVNTSVIFVFKFFGPPGTPLGVGCFAPMSHTPPNPTLYPNQPKHKPQPKPNTSEAFFPFRLVDLPWNSPWTWILTAVLVDLGYYWFAQTISSSSSIIIDISRLSRLSSWSSWSSWDITG